MLKSAEAGQIPDYSESLKSKVRSVHNTYFIFPVLFVMLSNHYPLIYNHKYNWLLLVVLSVAGALVRHTMVSKNPKHRLLLVPALLSLLFLVYVTAQGQPKSELKSDASLAALSFETDIQPLINRHCVGCHGSNPTDEVFKEAPKGLILETEREVILNKNKILQQVWYTQVMPLANKTNMTDLERQILFQWLQNKSL